LAVKDRNTRQTEDDYQQCLLGEHAGHFNRMNRQRNSATRQDTRMPIH
jgi:hypothetical protein